MVLEILSIEEIPQTGLCILDIFAKWCGPCKKIAPSFEELSKNTENVEFLKVDLDQVPEIEEKFDVSTIPLFLFFKDGKEVGRVSNSSIVEIVNKMKELKF